MSSLFSFAITDVFLLFRIVYVYSPATCLTIVAVYILNWYTNTVLAGHGLAWWKHRGGDAPFLLIAMHCTQGRLFQARFATIYRYGNQRPEPTTQSRLR
ncbi:hypothetical protein [Zooshikella ganghwensis]|uniref:Uncharacterized protein n=1 Tax=Zooshikella ganghwensis TaxID=202772 RepID=A0A4P9VRQ5_9GAMM|nr:hypothetical protein [Zooshikella ganghwensis]RDH46278.1 hypothetical protein B9G39_24080 [Zooshikella ganghwensis]